MTPDVLFKLFYFLTVIFFIAFFNAIVIIIYYKISTIENKKVVFGDAFLSACWIKKESVLNDTSDTNYIKDPERIFRKRSMLMIRSLFLLAFVLVVSILATIFVAGYFKSKGVGLQ